MLRKYKSMSSFTYFAGKFELCTVASVSVLKGEEGAHHAPSFRNGALMVNFEKLWSEKLLSR